MSNTGGENMSETEPDSPPPQEDPMHDVPVYPEKDPPPGQETDIKAAGKPREGDEGGPPNPGTPSRGKDEGHDVDDDDLDPKAPHSPPDASRGRVLFDENDVVS
jgi:hypothetical protein